MRRRVEVGLLFSVTGSYALIGAAGRAGALKAVGDVNADPSLDVHFDVVERNPGGNIDAYRPLCADMLESSGARHIIGTTTSSSRKELIPVLEKGRAALWYPCPHEGFEASDHVVYTHACPNQHLLPLLDWALPRFGTRPYLVGSNYIWGWESSRLARDVVQWAGGDILAERYLPIDDTDISRIISELRETQPDFVLNSLIGRSSYTFLEAMGELNPSVPVLSCNLTECELPALGPAADGVISAGPYFRGEPSWQGERLDFGCSFEAAAYSSVRLLAELLNGRPGAEALPLRELLAVPLAALLGIDRATHHMVLPALIAELRGGRFHVLDRRDALAPDPYLSRQRQTGGAARPHLQLVSP